METVNSRGAEQGFGAAKWADSSDRALVRAASLGDDAAFEQIVQRYGPGMYRFAVKIIVDSNDAQEAVQLALLSAYQNIGRFDGRSALRTWLYRIVHRRAVDIQRKRRPTPTEFELLDYNPQRQIADPEQAAVDQDLIEALREALLTLPVRQRSVWFLREVEEMSYDEIAEAIGATPGAVRGQLHRARSALAERMAPWR